MPTVLRFATLALLLACIGPFGAAAQPTPPSPDAGPPPPPPPAAGRPPRAPDAGPPPNIGRPPPRSSHDREFAPGELVNAGHRFFGSVSRGLAEIIEKAGSQWGQPNGYILGQEA